MAFSHRTVMLLLIMVQIVGIVTAMGSCRCKGGQVARVNVRKFKAHELQKLIRYFRRQEWKKPKCSTTCRRGYCSRFNRMKCLSYKVTRRGKLVVFCKRGGQRSRRCKVPRPRPGARDDPHITGFDGTLFDFHGVPGRNYAMFGRVGGEMLVARMRASGYQLWRPYIAKTYFSEFGLRTATDGPKVRVAMVQDGNAWKNQVTVDGRVVTRNYQDKHTTITFPGASTVHVATSETKYRFALLRNTDMRHRHLNVDVELLRTPSCVHQYVGVIGMTLNRALGQKVHKGLAIQDIRTSLRKFGSNPSRNPFKWTSKMEMTMRRFFEVNELFPPAQKNTAVLGGISARFVVSDVEQQKMMPIRMVASIS